MTVATAAPAAPEPDDRLPAAPKFQLLKSQTIVRPRDEAVRLAREHQELPRSPTERNLDPSRVKELVQRIELGVWLPCCWATVLYGEKKYRMNGQHSSAAMIEAADFLPLELAIHLDEYEAEDREQMAVLFRQFDARMSSRSKADVAGAYQGLVPELDDVPREVAMLGMMAISWFESRIGKHPVGVGDSLFESFFTPNYHAFLHWLVEILTPWKKVGELRTQFIVGAMYGTYQGSQSGANEFWRHISRPDLNDDTDPRAFLSIELNKIHEEKLKPRGGGPEVYCKCIKAWNAFRSEEKVKSLTVVDYKKKGWPTIAS